jgi:hypothetical protein
MMDIAIRAAARPGQRRLMYLCAVLAGIAAGLVIGLAARVPGRIPAGARVLTVTPVFDYGSAPSRGESDSAFTIINPAAMARIAAVIDDLRQFPDGTYNCPADAGSALMLTAMQLTFKAAPGGPVLATVGADHTGCQFAWVTAGAHTVWPLDENTSSGQPVQQQVLAIAGVRWPYPPAGTPTGLRDLQGWRACRWWWQVLARWLVVPRPNTHVQDLG